MDLVPLRVTITRGMVSHRPQNLYPDFDQIEDEHRRGLSWQAYVDLFGGWHYHKGGGFGETDDYNPDLFTWFGMVLVEPAFAARALELFPELVTELDEAQFAVFYDTKAHAHEPAEAVTAEVLNRIRAKYGIVGGPFTAQQIATMDPSDREALDPEHPTPGLVRNRRKTWVDFKKARGFKVVGRAVSPQPSAVSDGPES